MNLIDKNRSKIHALCLKHNVLKLFSFGSILTDNFNENSDIDLIVDFQNIDIYNYANNYFAFKESLEKIFHREVDLLEDKAIRNPYLRESIDSTKQIVYG